MVIGAGPAAVDMHLPVLAKLRDRRELELVLVCDLQHERAAAASQKFGFLEHSGDGLEAIARPDIQVVYVFGSAQLHFEYGMAALRAGKHLFVEKPVAPSYADACELASLAKQRGLMAVGGHNRRFRESFAQARARAGKAGWRYAEAVFHKPESGKPASFGARTWLSANGIHALDALVFMMNGLPEHLTALAGEAGARQPSAFTALMRWSDGAQGAFLCNNNAGARREEYAFHAPGETCRIDDLGLAVEKAGQSVRTAAAGRDDGIDAEHAAFLHAIRSGIEPVHAIESLAPAIFLGELIERGFTGTVRLPAREATHRPTPRTAMPSVLIVQPRELQPALARLLPTARLASTRDVEASEGPRPDIVAAILGRGADPLSGELLARLPKLAVVGVVGLSVAQHDPASLLARDITLVNAAQTYAESVAEFALGLAILGRRRAFLSHDLMRRGGWGSAPPAGLAMRLARRARPLLEAAGIEPWLRSLWLARRGTRTAAPAQLGPRELRGATVGLIGWSTNARAFAARLLREQAHVCCYSDHASDLDLNAAGVRRVSLGEALASDIVSLHRGLTPRTRHFLGAAELEKLRPGAVFINIARGALVEPQALWARLARGDVFACLDTFETEPPAAADPLRGLPNVFLTSHLAGGSADMHAAAAHEVVGKIAEFLAGNEVEAISAGRLHTMT